MELFNVVLILVGFAIVLLNSFSTTLQRLSLPAPLLGLAYGVVVGPYGLAAIDLDSTGIEPAILLEEASRVTLAVALLGVALRLPHGYWSKNLRWILSMIGLGMACMWAIAAGVLWGLLDLSLTMALLIGAIVTPTDPVVSTPIVTGSVAEAHIPARVRYNISSESGLNDGLAYLFVFLPLLLLTQSEESAWRDWFVDVLAREVILACSLGLAFGYILAKLFNAVTARDMMEGSSYSGFVTAFGLLLLGVYTALGTNAILGIFVAAAVFGQLVSQTAERRENRESEIINRFFIIPIFILLGVCLPIEAWTTLGAVAPVAMVSALLLRRLVAVWLLSPFYKTLHSASELLFLSWFGAVGASALYYATVAQRETGRDEIFNYVTLAITLSLVVHGLTATPFGAWLHRRQA